MRALTILLVVLPLILACNLAPTVGQAPSPEPAVPSAAPPANPTTAPDAGDAPGQDLGTVTGKLSYPSSFIPPLRVVFFNLADGSTAYVDTAMNQGSYSIDLPEGTYQLVAYAYSAEAPPEPGAPVLAGGYTQAVPCGLTADCADHSLIAITVTAGQTVTADPRDWYAPQGAFPALPAP